MKSMIDFGCCDDLDSTEYNNWLEWKDVVDPQFEMLHRQFEIPEDKSPTRNCPVCGESGITDCELVLNNGKCPNCESVLENMDVPF